MANLNRSHLAPKNKTRKIEAAIQTSAAKRMDSQSRAALIEQTRRLMETTIDYVGSPEFKNLAAATNPVCLPVSLELPKSSAEPGMAFVSGFVQASLLTAEEEQACFLQMNFLKARAERNRRKLDLNRPSQSLVDRIEADLDEALKFRNRIVVSNLRLVVATARKLTGSLDRMSELISEGTPPLIRAVELFDVGLGNRFSTYATWAVRNQMLRLLKRARQRAEFIPGENAPPLEDLAERPNVTETEGRSPETRQRIVGRLLSSLSDRERAVVAARFGLEGHPHGQSLAIIASQVGLCKERVRQILMQSLLKLRTELTVEELDSMY